MHNKVRGQYYAFCCKLQPITRHLFRRWIFTRAPELSYAAASSVAQTTSLRQPSMAVRVRLAHCCSVASFVAVVIGFVASCMLHATSFMYYVLSFRFYCSCNSGIENNFGSESDDLCKCRLHYSAVRFHYFLSDNSVATSKTNEYLLSNVQTTRRCVNTFTLAQFDRLSINPPHRWPQLQEVLVV